MAPSGVGIGDGLPRCAPITRGKKFRICFFFVSKRPFHELMDFFKSGKKRRSYGHRKSWKSWVYFCLSFHLKGAFGVDKIKVR